MGAKEVKSQHIACCPALRMQKTQEHLVGSHQGFAAPPLISSPTLCPQRDPRCQTHVPVPGDVSAPGTRQSCTGHSPHCCSPLLESSCRQSQGLSGASSLKRELLVVLFSSMFSVQGLIFLMHGGSPRAVALAKQKASLELAQANAPITPSELRATL